MFCLLFRKSPYRISSDVLNILYSRCLFQCVVFNEQRRKCVNIYDLRTIRCFLLRVIRRFFLRTIRCFLICHSLPNDSGDKGIRTLDPLLARQVLSQLSYTPRESGSHLCSHAVSSIVFSAA